MDDDTKNHAKFLILSHLMFVCTYRKTFLARYGSMTKSIFEEMGAASDCSMEQMEVDQDLIHSLVKSEPRLSPRAIGGRLKQESTMRLWHTYEKEWKQHYGKERTLWS